MPNICCLNSHRTAGGRKDPATGSLNKIAEKHVGEEYTEELKEKLNSEIVKTVLEKISDQTEIPMECLVEINGDGELF